MYCNCLNLEEEFIIDKKELRQKQIQKLHDNQKQTIKDGSILLEKLIQTPEWKEAKTIATTVSGPIEVATTPLIQAAQDAGKVVYLPKTMPHRQMAFLPYTNRDDLVISSYGIPEPVYNEELVNNNVDLVIVPGLAFDISSNYRVGFGGGYYDRFLANYRGNTIALVPRAMKFEKADWDIEDHDIKIDKLITE